MSGLSFSTVPVSGRTNILQTSWEECCFKADEAHNQLWNILRALMVWELTKPHKTVLQTSLKEAEHIWTGRHCSLLELPFLTLAIFVSRVWIPVELSFAFLVLISFQKRRDSDTFDKNVWNSWTSFQLKHLAESWLYRVAFSLMDCPEDDNFNKYRSEIKGFLPVRQDGVFFFFFSTFSLAGNLVYLL